MSARVTVVIDYSNLFYGFENYKKKNSLPRNKKIDLNKITNLLCGDGNLVKKSIYLGSCTEHGKNSSFIQFLKRSGFDVTTKLLKTIKKNDGTTQKKM